MPQPHRVLPCPFCGSQDDCLALYQNMILCTNCGALGPPSVDPLRSWNMRDDAEFAELLDEFSLENFVPFSTSLIDLGPEYIDGSLDSVRRALTHIFRSN